MPEDPNGLQGWALEDAPAADLGGWQLEDLPTAKPAPGPAASAIHVPVASTLGGAPPKTPTPAFAKALEGLTPEQAQAKADENLKKRQGLFAYAKSRGMSDEAALHAVNTWEPPYNQAAQIDPWYLPPGQMKAGPNTAEATDSAATVARQSTTAPGRTFLGAMQGAGEAMADTLGFATSKIPKAIGTAFSAAGMDVAAQGMEQIGDRLAPEVPTPSGWTGKQVKAARATTEGQLAELAGSVGGTIPGLGVMGLKGIALKSATEAVDRAKQAGASDTTALLAGTLHGASFMAGGKAMELLPFTQTTSKAFAATEAVGRDVGFFQALGLAGNAIDKATFDPKREWDAGAKDSLVQGVAWGLLRVPRSVKDAKIRQQAESYKDGPFWYADDLERTARALEDERTTINSKFAEGQIDQMQADLLHGAKVARDFGDAQNRALAKKGWKMGPAAGQSEISGPPPEPAGPRPVAGALAGPAPEPLPPDSGKATPIAGAPSSPQPGGPHEVEHEGTTYGLDPNTGQVYERLPDGSTQQATDAPLQAVEKIAAQAEAQKSADLTQAEAAIHPYDWQIQKKAEAAQAETQAPASPVTSVTEHPAPLVTHSQFQAGLPEHLQDEFQTRLEALQDQPEAVREQINTLKDQMDALKAKVNHEVIAHWGEKDAKARTEEALNNLPAWADLQQRMSDRLSAHHQALQDHPTQAQALRDEFTEKAKAPQSGSGSLAEAIRAEGQQLKENPEASLQEYEKQHGNLINGDLMAEMLPAVKANPTEGHPLSFTDGVINDLTTQAYDRQLAKPVQGPDEQVLLTMGNAAVGKSTIARKNQDAFQTVLDTNQANGTGLVENINKALRSGRQATVLFVHAPLEEAVRRNMSRGEGEGRFVPILAQADMEVGTVSAFLHAWEVFKHDPNVRFDALENTAAGHETGVLFNQDAADFVESLRPKAGDESLLDRAHRAYIEGLEGGHAQPTEGQRAALEAGIETRPEPSRAGPEAQGLGGQGASASGRGASGVAGEVRAQAVEEARTSKEVAPPESPKPIATPKEASNAVSKQGTGAVGPHGGRPESPGREGSGGVRQGQQGSEPAGTLEAAGQGEGETPAETPAAPEAQPAEVPAETQGEVRIPGRQDGWRENLIKARRVANSLGIQWQGQNWGLDDLLQEIDRKDAETDTSVTEAQGAAPAIDTSATSDLQGNGPELAEGPGPGRVRKARSGGAGNVGSPNGTGSPEAAGGVPEAGAPAAGTGRSGEGEPVPVGSEGGEPSSKRGGAAGERGGTASPLGGVKPFHLDPGYIESLNLMSPGGQKKAAAGNLEVLETLKKLKDENRLLAATPEEQAKLAKWVGWGGLQKALDSYKARQVERMLERGWALDTELADWNTIWGDLHRKIAAMLTPDELEAAKNSTLNAHYTHPKIIARAWDLARQFGFKGGAVLEPAGGKGDFLGLMPADLRGASSLAAVELDPTTADVLRALYPEASVFKMGFEAAPIPDGSMDLIVSNFPFGNFTVRDKDHPEWSKYNIHTYFFLKGLSKLKPGGVMIAITGLGTMDAPTAQGARELMAKMGDLVGAARLPDNSFEKNAGTSVPTDILIFRRKSETPFPAAHPFGNVIGVEVGLNREGQMVYDDLNEYYVENPQNILGTLAVNTMNYGEKGMTVKASGDINAQFAGFQERLPRNFMGAGQTIELPQAEEGSDVPEGTLSLDAKGNPVLFQEGSLVPVSRIDAKMVEAAKAYVTLRDSLKDLLRAEATDVPDKDLEPQRAKMRQAYERLVGKKNPQYINNSRLKVNQFLANDPEFLDVASLEIPESKVDPKTGKRVETYRPADILSRRILPPVKEVTHVDTPQDALLVSLLQKGKVDPEYMGGLLGMDPDMAMDSLRENNLIFHDPDKGFEVPAWDFLSGNVRAKVKASERSLAQAKEHDDQGMVEEMSRNIEHLKKVVPPDLPIERIHVKLGAGWVPAAVYQQFALEVMGIRLAGFKFDPATKTFIFNDGGTSLYDRAKAARWTAAGAAKSLTTVELFNMAMRWDPPRAEYIVSNGDGTSTTHKDPKFVEVANAAIEELHKELNKWLQQKGNEHAAGVADTFNTRFNSYVDAKIPVPEGMTRFPGQAAVFNGRPFHLETYQVQAILRGITNNLLLDHVVGSGKTLTGATIGMEMRRLGLKRKPMIVVPTSVHPQYVAQVRQLYPGAKIMAPGAKQREGVGRRKFIQSLGYNDFDLAILTYEFMTEIPDSPGRIRAYVNTELTKLEDAIQGGNAQTRRDLKAREDSLRDMLTEADVAELAQEQGISLRDARKMIAERNKAEKAAEKAGELGQNETGDKKRDKTVKEVQKAKQGRVVRMQDLLTRKQQKTLNWDQLGIDALIVDEAHNFKRLDFFTRIFGGRNATKGVEKDSSKRGLSLLLKTQSLNERYGGRIITMTGTPLTNTIAEVWHHMRYVRPDVLKEAGIEDFDDFAQTFGLVTDSVQMKPSGNFGAVRSLGKFQNAHRLYKIYAQGADMVRSEQIKRSRLPKLSQEGGTTVPVPIIPETAKHISFLRSILEAFQGMSGKDKKRYSWVPIVVYGRSKQASLDPRMIDNMAPAPEAGKLQSLVNKALEIYRAPEYAKVKAAQAIFLDNFRSPAKIGPLVIPDKERFDAFEEIKRLLVAGGVPEAEIAVVRAEMSKDKRAKLFEQVNDGSIRFVLGGNETLGTGVNIQTRLIANHNGTLALTPAMMEQRDGRLVRSGNMFDVVHKFTYGMEGTLDSFSAQVLTNKEKFINQFRNGDENLDELEDMDSEGQPSAEDMIAAFAGDDRVKRKIDLMREVSLLTEEGARHRGAAALAKSRLDLLNGNWDGASIYAREEKTRMAKEAAAHADEIQERAQALLKGHFEKLVQERVKEIEKGKGNAPGTKEIEEIRKAVLDEGSHWGFETDGMGGELFGNNVILAVRPVEGTAKATTWKLVTKAPWSPASGQRVVLAQGGAPSGSYDGFKQSFGKIAAKVKDSAHMEAKWLDDARRDQVAYEKLVATTWDKGPDLEKKKAELEKITKELDENAGKFMLEKVRGYVQDLVDEAEGVGENMDRPSDAIAKAKEEIAIMRQHLDEWAIRDAAPDREGMLKDNPHHGEELGIIRQQVMTLRKQLGLSPISDIFDPEQGWDTFLAQMMGPEWWAKYGGEFNRLLEEARREKDQDDLSFMGAVDPFSAVVGILSSKKNREMLVRVAKQAGAAVRDLVKSAVGTPIGTAKLMDALDARADASAALAKSKNLEPFHVGEVQFQVKDGRPFLKDGNTLTPLSHEDFSSLYQAERAKEVTALKLLYSGVNVREAIQGLIPHAYQAYGENIGKFEGLAELPSRLAQKRPETFGWVYEQIKRWDDQVKQHEAAHVEPRRALLGVKPEEAHRLGAFFADARFEKNPEATEALKDFHREVWSHWNNRIKEAQERIKTLEEVAKKAESDAAAFEKAGEPEKARPLLAVESRIKRIIGQVRARIPEYQNLRAEARTKGEDAQARGRRYSAEELQGKGFSPKAAEVAGPYLQDFTDQIQELEDASRARAMLSKLRASVRLANLEDRLAKTTDNAEAAKIEQEIADTEDSIDAAQWLANKYKEIRLTDTAYFPLNRRGDWGIKWMTEDKEGNPYILGFVLGDKHDVMKKAADLEKANPSLKGARVKRSPVLNWQKDFIKTKAIPVSKIEKAALMAGLSGNVADKLAYELETLDLENAYASNYKAHLRGVKGVLGFETDPIAAHAEYTAGAAKYRAHLMHTHEISRRIADLEGDRIGDDGVDWGVSKHKDDINYLKKLTADVFMNPVSPWIARIQSLTAMSALGLNPAFMIQQGVQKLTHEEATFASIYGLADRTKAIATAFNLASKMAMTSGFEKAKGNAARPWEDITPGSLSLISDSPEVRDQLAAELRKVLKHAEEEGLFLDQVRQETRRQASGEDSALSRAQEKAERLVFSMITATENHNRRQTFIAQYLLARTVGFPVKPGLDVAMEPDKIGGYGEDFPMQVLPPKTAEILAGKQVDWIHNRRGVTNRSELQRAARGVFMPATQFKYFSIEYLKQMENAAKAGYAHERQQGKSKPQAAMAATMPIARSMGWHLAMAGVMGVPFLTFMLDLVYVVMNEIFGPLVKGANFRPWKHWRQAVRESMQKAGAAPWMVDLFFRGTPGAFGGLSLERSLGMGDVFQINRGDSLAETGVNLLAGAAGQNVQQVGRVVKKAREGSYAQAAASVPGVPKGVRQATTAFTEDKMKLGGGRNVALTPGERSMRAIGLTPTRLAEARDIAANQNWEAQNARERKDFFSKRIGKAFEDVMAPATSKEGASDLSRLFGSLGSYNSDMAIQGRINELVNPKDMKAPIRDVTGGTRKGVAFQQELVRRTKR